MGILYFEVPPLPMRSTVLFESRLRLVANVYFKVQGSHLKKQSYIK